MKKQILILIFSISSFIGISQNDLMYSSTSNTVPAVFPGAPLPEDMTSNPNIYVAPNDSIFITNVYNWLNSNGYGMPSVKILYENPNWVTLNPTTLLRFKAPISGTSTYTIAGSGFGMLLKFSLTTMTSTGINILSQSGMEKLSMFPNPTSGQLNISGLDLNQKQMTITNVVGDNVRTIETKGNIAISVDVENLSPGVYFINSNSNSVKFIKE
jgi:hypothetical protein